MKKCQASGCLRDGRFSSRISHRDSLHVSIEKFARIGFGVPRRNRHIDNFALSILIEMKPIATPTSSRPSRFSRRLQELIENQVEPEFTVNVGRDALPSRQ